MTIFHTLKLSVQSIQPPKTVAIYLEILKIYIYYIDNCQFWKLPQQRDKIKYLITKVHTRKRKLIIMV